MVMQSGEDPAGGKDSKSAKPLPWKYIALAAIVAAAILGIFFAATSGIFSSDPATIADTTASSASTSSISGASQPTTNSGLILTDNQDDNNRITKTRIPNPNEITQDRLIDISNPPEFVQANIHGFVFTDIEISNNKITAAFLGVDKTQSHRIKPVQIFFYDAEQNRIYREQQRCSYYDRYYDFEYKMGDAYCEWPKDYCGLTWEEYWKRQRRTVKSITEDVVPRINAGEKYTFSINNCPIPNKAKYALITTIHA